MKMRDTKNIMKGEPRKTRADFWKNFEVFEVFQMELA